MISFFGAKSSAKYEKLAYDLKFKGLDGRELSLNSFKDKVIIVIINYLNLFIIKH